MYSNYGKASVRCAFIPPRAVEQTGSDSSYTCPINHSQHDTLKLANESLMHAFSHGGEVFTIDIAQGTNINVTMVNYWHECCKDNSAMLCLIQ